MGSPFSIHSDNSRKPTPGRSNAQQSSAQWRGETLVVIDADGASGAHASAAIKRKSFATLATTRGTVNKPLTSRRVAAEKLLARLPLPHLAKAMVATADASAVRRLATQLLRGVRLPARDGRSATTRRSYLAARAAGSYLDPDVDEDDALALITPLNLEEGDAQGGGDRQPPENMQELHELLRDVALTDRGRLATMLAGLEPAAHERRAADCEPLPRDPDALFYALRPFLDDKAALADRLRRAQGLPPHRDADADADAELVARLRQEIRDAAGALEADEGSTVFALVNGANAAINGAKSGHPADPARFLDAYTDIVKVGENAGDGEPRHAGSVFAKQFTILLERFSAEELRNGVLGTVRQALTDDLNAATRSRDTVFLSITVQHIRNLAGLTTLTELAGKLAASINRMRMRGAT